MEKTKIAVVGLGTIAQLVHLPILSKLSNVELVAVSEINKTRLKTVGEKFGIKNQYTDFQQMLSQQDCDAVIIATPTNSHTEIAIECLKSKRHVLIEKPISRNLEEAREINAASKKYKKQAMVGMNLRFRPDAMLMKSLLGSGELGDIFYIRCGWLRKQSSEQKWFINKSQSGGGVIIDLGILILDLALWIMDDHKMKSVSVQKFSHNTKDVEDSAVGMIRFEGDHIISFEVSWDLHAEWDKFHLAAFGTEGTAHLNPLRAYKRVATNRIDYTLPNQSKNTNLFKKSYENELKHFVGMIRQEGPFASSSEDAVVLMRLLEAMYESAESQKEIIL